jgi:hypothetical protein
MSVVEGATFCHACGARCEAPPTRQAEYPWVAEARKAKENAAVRSTTETSANLPNRTDNKGKGTKIVWQGLVSLVVLVWLLSRACGGSEATHPDPGPVARAKCEDYVKDYLKAPATAEFSGFADTQIIAQGHNKYAVIGWVDSQNSFGAELRTKYVCKTTDEGNGQWSFEPLVVNDGSE